MLGLPEIAIARPRTIEEAIALLRDGGAVLAGGTDLVPAMKLGLRAPARLVSLRRVQGMRGVCVESDGTTVIGAATTLAEIADDAIVRARLPALARAASLVASPQIRNAATLGGNVCLDTRCAYFDQSVFWRDALGHCLRTSGDTCHVVASGRRCVAASSADTPAPLLAYGAALRLASFAGERVVPLSAFFVADGARNTTRGDDELVVDVRVPPTEPGLLSAYVKLRARGAIDFPMLGVALAVWTAAASVRRIALVVNALGARPRVVTGLDAIACGRPVDAAIDAIAERARAQCHPLENIHGDAAWRREMIPTLVKRAFAELRASDSS